jgi:putative chitinase
MIPLDTALIGLRAAAPDVPKKAIKAFRKIAEEEFGETILSSIDCAAIVFGQLAHESADFTATEENLSYSAKRIAQVWPRDFTRAQAKPYARKPKKLANEVYGGRLGNTRKGDGWRFRGAGYIHLTGRANFAAASEALGIDYEARPTRARAPAHAWRIANWYLCTRKRKGVCLIDLAKAGKVKAVTRGINGGLNGHADRARRAALAREAMLAVGKTPSLSPVRKRDRASVRGLQRALIHLGYPCGPADGVWGPLTKQAVIRFQSDHDLRPDGIVGPRTFAALKRKLR